MAAFSPQQRVQMNRYNMQFTFTAVVQCSHKLPLFLNLQQKLLASGVRGSSSAELVSLAGNIKDGMQQSTKGRHTIS